MNSKKKSRNAERKYSGQSAECLSKEESLDKKLEVIEKREASYTAKEEELKKKKSEIEKLHEQSVQELERISGLTSDQAKEYLLKTVEDEVKSDTAKMVKELESRAKEEAGKKAKEYVVTAHPEMRCRPCGRDNDLCGTTSKR